MALLRLESPSGSVPAVASSHTAVSDIQALEEHRTALQVQLFAHKESALATLRANRPLNTLKAYSSKQKEWVLWCREKAFADGELISQDKVIWFLKECVLGREIRNGKRKMRTTEAGDIIKQTIGPASIEIYLSALIDLYTEQRSRGQNAYDHPRGKAVKAVLEDFMRQEHQRKRKEFVDRGAGTLQDGYTGDQMIQVVRYCWTAWRNPNRRYRTQIEPFLRTIVDFLFSHHMLLRGEDRRRAELADLFTLPLTNEGPSPCFPMILILDNGKTNKNGRIEYGAVVRHRNPLLCTLGQTAFYLFYRWNIVREAVPRFQQRHLWYQDHLLRGDNITIPLSYATQLDWINRVFDALSLSSLKKTHAGRGQGARQAELGGVDEAQIRRAGRWNSDALTGAYLTHIPLSFVRAMAGFRPQEQGSYFLTRAQVVPSPALEHAVWPWVDIWLEWFDRPYDGNGEEEGFVSLYEAELIEHPEWGPQAAGGEATYEDRKDLAAQGFLHLLVELRRALLQDSIVVRQEFPDHPIWTDPVFHCADYLRFAEEIGIALQNPEEPEELQLRRTNPLVADRLNMLQADFNQSINRMGLLLSRPIQGLQRNINDLLSGKIPLRFDSSSISPSPQSDIVRPAEVLPETIEPSDLIDLNPVQAPGDGERSETFYTPEPSIFEFPAVRAVPMAITEPARYTLSRTIHTVPDLWREWTQGLPGQPSVESLDASYGASWRPEGKERVFYSRRKVIINEIRRKHEQDQIPLSQAIGQLELVRFQSGLSLYKLAVIISRTRKASPS